MLLGILLESNSASQRLAAANSCSASEEWSLAAVLLKARAEDLMPRNEHCMAWHAGGRTEEFTMKDGLQVRLS